MISAHQKERFFFLAVGSTAAAVHFATVWLLVRTMRIAPEWANVAAFWLAFSVSYTGHHRLTFAHSNRQAKHSVVRWMMVSIGGFLLNQSLYMAALQQFPNTHYLVLLFIVTAAVTVMTYLLGKYWAFAA